MKKLYMCGASLASELGETDVSIYPTVKGASHGPECGVAQVKVEFVRWAKKPKEFSAKGQPDMAATKWLIERYEEKIAGYLGYVAKLKKELEE